VPEDVEDHVKVLMGPGVVVDPTAHGDQQDPAAVPVPRPDLLDYGGEIGQTADPRVPPRPGDQRPGPARRRQDDAPTGPLGRPLEDFHGTVTEVETRNRSGVSLAPE
jgi:hypothetical protein